MRLQGEDPLARETVKQISHIKIILTNHNSYIFQNKLGFHSNFQSKLTLFGNTILMIPYDDITTIEKRYNAVVFDNSIAIITKKSEIFLTSFINRDKAFELIDIVLAKYGKNYQRKPP